MSSFAFRTTGWTLDIATKLIKADIRLHNARAIHDDMAIIFVVNHFTRLETLLLPYVFNRELGLDVWSLAADELFRGKIGAYLRSVGSISTKDPDRDTIIVHGLLKGENPWIIFPEGGMIKDKKVVDHTGLFRVYSKSGRRPPHSGAARLALRAEFFRHKLACIRDNPRLEGKETLLERFHLESLEQALGKRTVIVPVNITYFPLRAHENVILRMARVIAGNLSERAQEELSVEGTILARESDIDITLGEPIDVHRFLETPECAAIMACGDKDMELLEQDQGSIFNHAARRLMYRYMSDIYRLTTINYEHIGANLIRYQHARPFTEETFRDRVFLCTRRIAAEGNLRMHGVLRDTYSSILYNDSSEKLDQFIELCLAEGALERSGHGYVRNDEVWGQPPDFHEARRLHMTRVIANEIEPLGHVTRLIAEIAQMPASVLARNIRAIFLEEDQRIFERDYEAHFHAELSKDRAIGRPFLLLPRRIRAGIVLVHGYLAAPTEVRAMAEYFYQHGFAVYCVRLKGHGTAPADLAAAAWEEWYESVNRGYAIIRSLTRDIVLGGFSTGGGLALIAAARKRDRVCAVFSINAPLELQNYAAKLAPTVVTMHSLLRKLRRRSEEQVYVDNFPENPHINYTKNPLTGVRELGRCMDAMDAILPEVTVPTLIIQGSKDRIVNPASGRLIFEKLGAEQKELTIFERKRHGIINGPGAIDVFERARSFVERALARRTEIEPVTQAEMTALLAPAQAAGEGVAVM